MPEPQNISAALFHQFKTAGISETSEEIGLDLTRFRADQNGPCKGIVASDQASLSKVGLRGTPGFFINGRFLSGARPIDQFKTLIDEELAKAKKRIRKGTKRRKYYQTWVVEKGKKNLAK